ncbi:MAG TPA: polysaccharide deacetylase family protein [Desulfomonilia bacterium]|nr:polysaccharide deacetylase family protein [Desulfomonilia bacterium]
MRAKIITYTTFTLVLLSFFFYPGWRDVSAADQKAFVLCYHSFLGNKHFAGDVSLQDLRAQMDFFKNKGFHFASFADILKGTLTGTQNILIVIDDGNESVFKAYHDIFKPLHIIPILAIYPSIIGKKSYALTWDQLNELSQDGCDIASHGYYHLLMNDKLYLKDKTSFDREIYSSKKLLEEKLHKKVSIFVYPNGVRSDITKRTLKDAGYSYAFTITWGTLLSPMSLNKDPLELPRYMLYQNNWKMIESVILKASAE